MSTTVCVVVYSDDSATRRHVITTVGCRPDSAVGPVEFVETATHAALLAVVAAGGIDLVVVDGEASPSGGLGLARQLKDELPQCPPLMALIARDADVWLAAWSGADVVLGPTYSSTELVDNVIRLLRHRRAVIPSARTAR